MDSGHRHQWSSLHGELKWLCNTMSRGVLLKERYKNVLCLREPGGILDDTPLHDNRCISLDHISITVHCGRQEGREGGRDKVKCTTQFLSTQVCIN